MNGFDNLCFALLYGMEKSGKKGERIAEPV